jgi:hypothetical protein
VPNGTLFLVALGALAMTSAGPRLPDQAKPPGEHSAVHGIPSSVAREHKKIHDALTTATKAPGRVGAAARELAGVLGPHFEREEQIALPPLGLLAPLAAGERRSTGMNDVLAMTDALRKEMPRMLEEHQHIRAAVERLRTSAREERASEPVELADELAAHAISEEEVLYPAAILVGEVIRART